MSNEFETSTERRQFLRLLGSSAVLIPVVSLSGCGGDSPPEAARTESAMPATEPKPQAAPPKPASPPPDTSAMQASTPPAKAPSGDLPKVSLDDPQAKALGYVHDATTVDKAAQPRYQEGQACKNCALYTGGDKPWGGCGIFGGRAVNAEGWCTAYAPKPS